MSGASSFGSETLLFLEAYTEAAMSTSLHPERPLPRGRHAAPREVVWRSQRGRMLAAMATAVAEKGYGGVSVADVIRRAGVSRRTFYEHFDKKEECFLAAYDAGVEALLDAIDDAIRVAAPAGPLAVARAGTARYLETLAQNPAFARTFLVEILAAGPEALDRRARVHARFADQLATIHRAAGGRGDAPPVRFRACVGAIHEVVTDHVIASGAETLPDLLDALVEIETALLVRDP
jgi:AcrR family transcriptional regulator